MLKILLTAPHGGCNVSSTVHLKNKMIYIIIPVHNRIDKTMRCLDSIYSQNYENISVVMVDDGSSDSTAEKVSNLYPKTIILSGKGDLFWTGAVSFGINHVLTICREGDWILLVNNDVQLKNNTIEKLVTFAISRKRKVLVSALSVSSINRDVIIKSGTKVKSWALNITQHVLQGESISKISSYESVEVDLLTARCLLHPVEIFLDIGNYNAVLLPHYGGDDEFTVRANNNGYKTCLLPTAVVYLDDEPTSLKLNIIQQLFSIKSSLNLINRWKFARAVVPIYAFPSYFFIAVIKAVANSFYIVLRRK
jgi:GT2 family glycosyltransferase